MALKDDLLNACTAIAKAKWDPRDGREVPDVEAVALKNDAVKIDAAVLYADLANSTGLIDTGQMEFAAKMTRVFLYVASQIAKKSGGEIRSFDGDRVMAVFVGKKAVDNASLAAFQINGARSEIMIAAMKKHFGKWNPDSALPWPLEFGVGLDSSEITVIKAGVRGDNDLVWLGKAANYAAKLSSKRDGAQKRVYCTPGFYALTPFKNTKGGGPVWTKSADGSYYSSAATADLS